MSISVFYFLFVLLLVAASVSARSELEALMDLKSALDPDDRYLRTWTLAGDPCAAAEFDGVACNDRRRVANVSLQGRGLSGRLSPAIAGLTSLTGLYLHFNSLTGPIPAEISSLAELTDLYLDVNNLTGAIPPEIGGMRSLQVLQLSCNRLTGTIPSQLGSLKKLTVLAIQYNHLTGSIPSGLGNLAMLKALYLSNNNLSGPIPVHIANIPQLQTFDVRNNLLTGVVPPALKKLHGGFLYSNNTGLCNSVFPSLRPCTTFDAGDLTASPEQPLVGPVKVNHTAPQALNSTSICNRRNCSSPPPYHQIIIVVAVVVATVMLAAAGFLAFFRHRRRKQKIGSSAETADSRLSTDQAPEVYSKSASPLVSLAYSTGWDPLADGLNNSEFSQEALQSFRFNMEDIQSATRYFSEANVLGKGRVSTVYRGVLRDGSSAAIKSVSVSSCKAEEDEFFKGMSLLISLRHENVVALRGFCCSRGRGECFLVYEFAPRGTLAMYLDASDHGGSGASEVLDWPARVSIIHGIAKGVHYLHGANATKPALVHQNLSASKILFDEHFNPLISDSGLRKILADDLVYSALKVSAAMGYLAPEYITTGRFTEKSDVYSFGVIVLQILSGRQKLSGGVMARMASDDRQHDKLDDLIDPNLDGKFSPSEASMLANLAMVCTDDDPDRRPAMEAVVRELNTGFERV